MGSHSRTRLKRLSSSSSKVLHLGFPGGHSGKDSTCQGRRCSIPGLGRSPEGGNGNLLQCSCLENPMDRGAWWATVHGVAKSQTRLKRLSMHACPFLDSSTYSFYLRFKRKSCSQILGWQRHYFFYYYYYIGISKI